MARGMSRSSSRSSSSVTPAFRLTPAFSRWVQSPSQAVQKASTSKSRPKCACSTPRLASPVWPIIRT